MVIAEKIRSIDLDENVLAGELLDEKGKVISKVEGETAVSRRLAKYFLAFFIFNLISIFAFPDEAPLQGFDYITQPFLQIIGGTLMVGLPYAVYRKFKHKSSFPKGKRLFYIHVWKMCLYIFGGAALLVLLLKLLFIS